MTKHIPPTGQSILVHKASADCACGPKKVVKTIGRSSGKRGGHQGYRQEVSFQHNVLTKEVAS